jgi:hypothetical protein
MHGDQSAGLGRCGDEAALKQVERQPTCVVERDQLAVYLKV